ncbi:rab GTPase-activating protein 1-like [Engraulis encrasicolus]|uniref:rab GTPase-activating protein 1-like n=1 Tax=Engraulis encrasicolus TaxID=184585 RepID=UPI002FD686A9
MMEEVSISVAYNAHVIDQMSEEEILASLVAESLPKQPVPSKKLRQEDPLDRYQQENLRLQETSLRLEQENDHLAHKLVTSKIALRNALDQTEDKVDELTQELLRTRHDLEVTAEEKRETVEETNQLKELFKKELDKARADIARSHNIIADYKQICSQLNERLERQETENNEELALIKSKVLECERCCKHVNMDGTLEKEPEDSSSLTRPSSSSSKERDMLQVQVQELERELAQTKLQMVEAKCRIQELEHQNGSLKMDLQTAKHSWLRKTLGSLKMTGGGTEPPVPRDEILAPVPISNSRSGWVTARRLTLAALREKKRAQL